MTSYKLLENYIENLEALLRKKRSRAASSSATPPIVEPINPAPFATLSMAKTLCDYSTPAVANMPVGPAVNIGDGNFELHTGLIMMVQANQFHGLLSEDANIISNTSSSCVTRSSSRMSHRRASGSACFLFPF